MTSKKIKKDEFQDIEVENISPPRKQDRLEIDQSQIEELAQSILEIGLLSPIEVVKTEDGYEIVFGHRRWLAHKVLKKEYIKARVIELNENDIKIRRATENIGRANLTPLEEGLIYTEMVEGLKYTTTQISKKFGRGEGRIRRHIALTKMPIKIRDAVHFKRIKIGVAEELWRCIDNGHREYLLELSIEHGVTVQVVRKWVTDYNRQVKQGNTDIGDGGGEYKQMETQPTYYPCDLCNGPEDISKQKTMRMCQTCYVKLMEIIKE